MLMRTMLHTAVLLGCLALVVGCASPAEVQSSSGVKVDASDTWGCMLGSLRAENGSGSPVAVRVEVGVYRDDELIEVAMGTWNLPAGGEGRLYGFSSDSAEPGEPWPLFVWRMRDDNNVSCRVRDVQVTERG